MPDKEFKVMITKMLTGLDRKVEKLSDTFNKRKVFFKNQSDLKNTINWDPWVAQRFGACLWPRARSWRPGIESHIGLPVHGACFSPCLCLCLSLSLSLCAYHK